MCTKEGPIWRTGASRFFDKEHKNKIKLKQLIAMTMVSVSNSMVGSLSSVELCAVT
jgi:hypothetical protein